MEKHGIWMGMSMGYPPVNEPFDPENHLLVETHFPTPMTSRIYLNLLEGIYKVFMG